MITAADGTAFTSAVTVYVTGDAGTQAIGSVGSGACTHEGNGFHTYAPAQAETNYDHVAFTFIGTGAIPATIQMFTTFPQTGDNFARIGAPAGASVSADIAAVKSDSAAILVDTGTTLDAALAVVDANVDAILADTGTDGVVVASASKTGYSLTATTGLGNQTADITGSLSGSVGSVTGAVGSVTGAVGSVTADVGITATAVDNIWDEVLTGGTHNVASSAGRRLRTLQTGGNYEGGMVWVDTVNGAAGTTVDENGVVTNPVSTWADALTLSAAIPLKAFHIANGSTVTLTASSANYVLDGHEWTLALGGQSVATTMIIDAEVSGTGTGGATEFQDCIFGITSLESMQAYDCSFTATTSGGFTMSAAGAYRFINCQSGVAGSGAPLFTLGTGAITAEFRRWSGGIQVAGVSSDDVLTIGGEMGTITLGGADGTVEIRGSYKAIVDNRTGSPTLNLDGAFKAADVATILADTNELQTDWANGGRLDLILDSAASAGDPWATALPGAYGAGTAGEIIGDWKNAGRLDAILDSILVDTAEIGVAGAGLTNINLPNQTMDITGNITGNLSGSVGSVTGATGSVTGLTASDVAAIKAKTDSLTFTKALELDSNIQSVNGVTVNGDGAGTPMGV